MDEGRTAPPTPARADAEDRLQRLLELQRLLFRVSRDLGPATELQPVLDTVLGAMRDLVRFKGGSICLVEGDAIRLVVSDPPVSADVRALRLPIGEGLSGRVVETGEPLYSPDLLEDPRVPEAVHRTGSNITIRSWIGVPLVVLGDVIGLLQVDSAEPDAFDEIDRYVLEGLGVLVAGAIESARRFESVVELERLKSEFIERVSHELRTPITIMAGFASTLQEQGHDLSEEDRRVFIDRITHASARLRYVVEEILTLSSLDAGTAAPAPIGASVRDIVAHAGRNARGKGAFTVDVDPSLRVRTDPTILERVLEPLIDNAVKYAGEARVVARRSAGRVVIDVEDRGPGVEEELRERMFERFTRGRHTIGGMGLGLAIANHLAGTLHATLTYEVLDPGSRFRVDVPDLSSP